MCEHHKPIPPYKPLPVLIPRTTLRQILRFAWTLWRSPMRQHLRISQMVMNFSDAPYYVENDDLIKLIRGLSQ